MRDVKRKKAKSPTAIADAASDQRMNYRRSRQLARRLMRRGVFNKRIVEQAESKRGRG